MFRIVPFQEKYRDDVIFCILCAKDALGRVPNLNEDLLDIQANYFDKDDMFWVALNEADRVIGMIGTNTISDVDMWLKRLFIKPEIKRQGMGSALLIAAEKYAKLKDIKFIHTRFADDFAEAFHFYRAKGFVESERSDGFRHFVKDIAELAPADMEF